METPGIYLPSFSRLSFAPLSRVSRALPPFGFAIRAAVDYAGAVRLPSPMNSPKTVVQVQVRAVLPTKEGWAVFLGNPEKTFTIYVDQSVGSAITMFMRGTPKERPMTHDLMALLMTALGAKVERVIINELKNATYFARIIIGAENELTDRRKLVEMDARPSDSIALALQASAPIFVSRDVWEEVDDMSDVLKKMEEGGFEIEG